MCSVVGFSNLTNVRVYITLFANLLSSDYFMYYIYINIVQRIEVYVAFVVAVVVIVTIDTTAPRRIINTRRDRENQKCKN